MHVAITGPSGCGKSTVLRLLAGLDAPDRGEIYLNGAVISSSSCIAVPAHKRELAMVFQDLALWPNLSALENVMLGLSGVNCTQDEKNNRALEALKLCAIEGLYQRMPGQLSGGQQQRLALARAVALTPKFLLLDEPFSGLDLLTKMRLLDEIASLADRRKITLILVSHDPFEATALCRNAVVLNEGVIEESGLLAELIERPKSEILKIFKRRIK
ncbi:MAG: ATP-binding cassette domain-containing protein [Deltaproteobacteria bacterium]|nr:ATP-binding cassette domain-containing protein [Deltaproteobacteria bacterium]